jgi:hypothetical protein
MSRPTFDEVAEAVGRRGVHPWVVAPLVSGQNPDGTPYHLPVPVAEWSVTATAENADVIATRPAEPGRSHYVTYVGGSYSGATSSGELKLWGSNTLLGDYFVHDVRGIPLTFPLRLVQGAEASLSLAAGGLGVRGAVTLQGYTI